MKKPDMKHSNEYKSLQTFRGVLKRKIEQRTYQAERWATSYDYTLVNNTRLCGYEYNTESEQNKQMQELAARVGMECTVKSTIDNLEALCGLQRCVELIDGDVLVNL